MLVDRLIVPYMLTNQLKKILLILDQAPPHISKSLQSYMRSKKILMHFIPKNLTGILQPGDTHLFAGMKRCLKHFFLINKINLKLTTFI